MIPLQVPSRKIFITAGIALAVLLSVPVFSHFTQALSVRGGAAQVSFVAGSSGTVHPSSTSAVGSTGAEPMLEVHIANNGLVLLRGARVTSISGSIIRVITSWDSGNFTWSMRTNQDTAFITPAGERGTLAGIAVGDFVTVTGHLTRGGEEFSIDAQTVRKATLH